MSLVGRSVIGNDIVGYVGMVIGGVFVEMMMKDDGWLLGSG